MLPSTCIYMARRWFEEKYSGSSYFMVDNKAASINAPGVFIQTFPAAARLFHFHKSKVSYMRLVYAYMAIHAYVIVEHRS